jgi:hypothetical protein
MDNRAVGQELPPSDIILDEYQRCYSTAEIEMQVFYGEQRPLDASGQCSVTNAMPSTGNTAYLPQPSGELLSPIVPASGLLRFADGQ